MEQRRYILWNQLNIVDVFPSEERAKHCASVARVPGLELTCLSAKTLEAFNIKYGGKRGTWSAEECRAALQTLKGM